MAVDLSDVDFQIPSFLVHHFYVTGTFAVLINLFVFYLIVFRNEKMDSFRYYMLSFQIACCLCDIHLSFLMQPIPLFPLRAGHCAGFLSTVAHLSSHTLMTVLSLLVGVQVNSLNICFLRKHHAIAKINRKTLPACAYNALLFVLITYPFSYTICFHFSKVSKEDEFRILHNEYTIFRPQFEQLPDYGVYEMNSPFLAFVVLIVLGCLQSTATVSLFVFLMYTTLLKCRTSLSRSTLNKHRTALNSLVIQFLTTPIAILPAMLIVSTLFIPFKGAQVFTWYMLMTMTTHSTINSLVVIFTFPEFRAFVMSWSKKRKRTGHSMSFVLEISGKAH